MAYDGKGNAVVKSLGELEPAMETLGGQKRGLYGEKWVNFTKVWSRSPILGAVIASQTTWCMYNDLPHELKNMNTFLRAKQIEKRNILRFEQEVAVMVARSREGEVVSYPVTETLHRDSICYVTQTPAQIPQELQDQAREIAEKAVGCLEGNTI